MKRIFVILSIVIIIILICIASTVAVPEFLSPSADPIAFIAAHKGGGAPNYYVEPEHKSSSISDYNVGPDGYEYFGKYLGGLFGICTRLSELVSEEESSAYMDDIFAESLDFNHRSFCRYFGITKEQYEEAMSVYSQYKYYGDGGLYKAEKYPLGVFGTYEDFVKIFVREEYRNEHKTEEGIPSDECIHTYTYHTISGELIKYVGDEEYASFREKYYGTEDFNILNFIDYFDISETEMQNVLDQSTEPAPAYKVKYLYGDEDMQRKYFVVRNAQ